MTDLSKIFDKVSLVSNKLDTLTDLVSNLQFILVSEYKDEQYCLSRYVYSNREKLVSVLTKFIIYEDLFKKIEPEDNLTVEEKIKKELEDIIDHEGKLYLRDDRWIEFNKIDGLNPDSL